MSENNYTTVTSDRSKTTTLILCIVLGFAGVHHFYVGRIGMGILYLFTGGLFCIGWIADIIKIATGTFKDGAGVPIRKQFTKNSLDRGYFLMANPVYIENQYNKDMSIQIGNNLEERKVKALERIAKALELIAKNN